MYPNYNYYQSTGANSRPIQSQLLKGRPVSSLEEVRAIGIDFDGSIFYFPDIANKRIYTKQINLDGTATLNMYELTSLPTASENGYSYITREEFNAALAQLKNLVQPSPQNTSSIGEEQPMKLDF